MKMVAARMVGITRIIHVDRRAGERTTVWRVAA